MNISNQKKESLEELLFQVICGAQEYYLIGRILRRIQNILKNDPEWIYKNIPSHKQKLIELKHDYIFNENLEYEILTLVSNCGKGERQLPRICAETYYRILEYCKDSKSNLEWFREYLKVNGRLENRIELSRIKLHFKLPIVPPMPQEDTIWARSLKKNMLMNFSTFMPKVNIFKAHNERTLNIKAITLNNNDEYISRAESMISRISIKENSSTAIINLFLSSPYQQITDLEKFEFELNIPKKFI